MEGIGVLHGELAHADQAAAGPGLVAELGLDLVDHEGVGALRLGGAAHQLHAGLLMGHAQHHVVAAAILEPGQLAADLVIAAALPPQIRGHHHGEQHLLAVNGIHFFPDDVLDLAHDAAGGHIQAVNAVGHLLHIAAADHKDLADDLAIGGRLAEAVSQHIGKLHASFLHKFQSPGHYITKKGQMQRKTRAPPGIKRKIIYTFFITNLSNLEFI